GRNELTTRDDGFLAISIYIKAKRPGVLADLPVATLVQHHIRPFPEQLYRARSGCWIARVFLLIWRHWLAVRIDKGAAILFLSGVQRDAGEQLKLGHLAVIDRLDILRAGRQSHRTMLRRYWRCRPMIFRACSHPVVVTRMFGCLGIG